MKLSPLPQAAEGIRKYCRRKSIIEERLHPPAEIYWYPTKSRNVESMKRAARLLVHRIPFHCQMRSLERDFAQAKATFLHGPIAGWIIVIIHE